METDEILRAYDAQLRRSTDLPAPGWTVALFDDPAPLLRTTAPEGSQWGDGVVWSDLDETSADEAIASTVAYFRGLGRTFEWKHHGYDRPADLTDRLRAAGFEPDDEEALMVGEVAVVRTRLADAPAPAGITIRRLREDDEGRAADWKAVGALHTAVWDEEATGYVAGLSATHAADPHAMSIWLAVADGTVVCAARANFHDGTDFASLWGGGTLEAYRGRGIYTALVSRRADEAAGRGFRYLQVDASPDSRPILERLGLRTLTTTTPWIWRP